MYNQHAKNFYMALYEGSLNVNKHVFHFKNQCSAIVLLTILAFFICIILWKDNDLGQINTHHLRILYKITAHN